MKKFLFYLIVATIVMCTGNVFAYTASLDKTKISDGAIIVNIKEDNPKGIKARVEKGGVIYDYDITQKSTTLPLQMGVGSYTIGVFEQVEGSKYRGILSETVKADKIDENKLYSHSIPIINFNSNMTSIKKAAELLKAQTDKPTTMYTFMVKNFAYDFDKAKTVQAGYVPNLDVVYNAKKGICYDYSSLLAGSLRSNGVPTRLVMGYAPDVKEYHAWNQIMVGGKWVTVDTTSDAQYEKAGVSYTMAKDSTKYKVVKVY